MTEDKTVLVKGNLVPLIDNFTRDNGTEIGGGFPFLRHQRGSPALKYEMGLI